MPETTINGLSFHYREAGDGYPVVFVHGFTGNSRNWALTAPVLAQTYRTVSIDLRGHGLSGKPLAKEDYTLELMASDVLGLVDRLGISDCFLVGHSMGGMIAQHVALERPGLLSALALVDTAAEPIQARQAYWQRLSDVARQGSMEEVFEAQLRANPLADRLKSQPQVLAAYREQFLMTSPEAFRFCARAMAGRRPLLEDLGSLDVLTLIVCGDADEPFLEPSRRMHQQIRGSRLEIVEGAGHTPQIERPGEFNAILSNFLASVQAPAARS